jgi:hypothetical protein
MKERFSGKSPGNRSSIAACVRYFAAGAASCRAEGWVLISMF